MIGERLKHAFTGNAAWILGYRDECFDQIGLKASVKIPLFNGALECQFRQYQLFDGKYKAFRSENAGKDFKPRRSTDSPRPKTRSFSRDGEQKSFRKKEDRPSGSRNYEGFRKEEGFRGRKAGDGKEFTRERRNEFRFKDESKPRTPRPSTDDGRPKQAPGPRYMHSRRKPEIERENNESMDEQ